MWEKVLNIFNYIGDNSGCHQIPERCFTIKGYTFPICARCTGAMIGQLAALIGAIIGWQINPWLSVGMVAIMGVDWGIQGVGIRQSTNTRRFITGLLGGYGVVDLMIEAVKIVVIYIIKLVM